jgi:signal transduction histidine kinase
MSLQDTASHDPVSALRTDSNAPLATNAERQARADDIAVICHELRNSLAIVRGAARLLRTPGAATSTSTTGLLIERHVGQMGRHIEDLLQLPRRNGHDHGLKRSCIDLCVLARFSLDGIRPEILRRRHRLVTEIPAQPVWALVDGARIEQAFANLLNNAVKSTPDGGDIFFTLELEGDEVHVRVRDSGVGIEPAMLPRVFDMFVQARSAHRGTSQDRGIGLAVVRNMIEQHGGTVTAASDGIGRGSEFTILLLALNTPVEPFITYP